MNGYIYAAIATFLFGGGFYLGGLRGHAKADDAKVAQVSQSEEIATAVSTALLNERAQVARQAKADNAAQAQHDKDTASINSAPPRSDPIIVYRDAPKVRCSTVPGDSGKASTLAANPAEGGGEPVDRGRDIRPGLEAVKKRLELVMADYRREDAEFPKP